MHHRRIHPSLVARTAWWAALLLTAGRIAARADTPRRPEELTLPEMRFPALSAEKVVLSNGIPVVLYENHDLPILDLTMAFRMGTRYLPADLHTPCALFGELWRDGGTTSISPDSLDSILTAFDATVSAQVGFRSGSVRVSLSSEDVRSALPLWRDVILHPGFEADRFARAKANRLRELQAINNDPADIADHHLDWLLLGRDFPSARLETRPDIEGATLEQLRSLHARFVRPQNAIIGVSGDFQRKEMLALLESLFRDWPVGGPYEPPVAEPWTPDPQPGVYLLRGDYAQSQVRLARLIPDLTDDSPELAAAQILSYGLGYERVFYRTREEGLSYGTAVMLNVGQERSQLRGFGSGRGEATLPLLRAMLEECKRVGADPIRGNDLEAARIFQLGMEVRSQETAAAIVSTKVNDLLRGRADDFHERYLERLKTAGETEVARLAERYVTIDEPWVVLVVGDPAQFGLPLDSLGLGPVRELTPVVFGE
jgi:zinc protease